MPNAYPVKWDDSNWGNQVGAQITDSAKMFMAARAAEVERRRRIEQEQYERAEQAKDRERQQKADAWQAERNKLDIDAAKINVQTAKQRQAEHQLELSTKAALEQGQQYAADPANAQRMKVEQDYFSPQGTQGMPEGSTAAEPPAAVQLPAVPAIEEGAPPSVPAQSVNPVQFAMARAKAAAAAAQQEGEAAGRLVRDEKGNLVPASVINARETANARADAAEAANAMRADIAKQHNATLLAVAGMRNSGEKPVKPPTGAERTALGFYVRGKEALEDAAQFEDKVSKVGLMGQARLQWLPNMAQSEEQQLYRQAQRSFTEARLRKESGAAIPDAEYEKDAKTYFAQPGDKDAVIDRKRARRASVLESLRTGAGRAYAEYTGEDIPTSANRPAAPEGGTKKKDSLGIR